MANYSNGNSVYSQKMLPVGKSLVYNSIKNEWQDCSDPNKLVTRYPNHKVDCSESRIDGFHRYKVNEIIEQAKNKKGRKQAWLKMFK